MRDALVPMIEQSGIADRAMNNFAYESSLTAGISSPRRLFKDLAATDRKPEGMAEVVGKRPVGYTGL